MKLQVNSYAGFTICMWLSRKPVACAPFIKHELVVTKLPKRKTLTSLVDPRWERLVEACITTAIRSLPPFFLDEINSAKSDHSTKPYKPEAVCAGTLNRSNLNQPSPGERGQFETAETK